LQAVAERVIVLFGISGPTMKLNAYVKVIWFPQDAPVRWKLDKSLLGMDIPSSWPAAKF
jgi:hypothetical protein